MSTLKEKALEQERKQFLFNVFVTALEGGIGYWSLATRYHIWKDGEEGVEDVDNFQAIVHEITDEDDEDTIHKPDRWGILDGDYYRAFPLVIDAKVIEKGVKLFDWYVQGIVDEHGKQVPLDQIKPFPRDHYFWQFVEANRTNGDSGDYDSSVADCIVQMALFGEVRYA